MDNIYQELNESNLPLLKKLKAIITMAFRRLSLNDIKN